MMNAILLALLMTAATPAFEVQTLDGKTIIGSLREVTPERVTLDQRDGRLTLETEDIVSIAARYVSKPLRQESAVIVTLADGSTIVAKQYTASGRNANITLLDGDVLKAALGAIQTVRFQAGSDATMGEWSRLIEPKSDGDLLVVQNGQGVDSHQGVLHDVKDDVLEFDLDGDRLPIKRAKVFGIAYRHGEVAELPAAICRIQDASGSNWVVHSFQLDSVSGDKQDKVKSSSEGVVPKKLPKSEGMIRWTTPTGLSLRQSVDNVTQIDFSGGKILYLSDLKPESVRWSPFFDVGKQPTVVEQFYAPRFDRGFAAGPLQLDGVEYRKGLALHCHTEMVYRLPDHFRKFRAIAGIADAARPGGNVRLIVQADGRTLFDSSMTGQSAPQSLNLDVSDVRRLTIVADFGEHFSVGDYLLLCNARLSK
jgi:hypothetical protein